MTGRVAALLIDEPFQKENNPCGNQDCWPPTAIPLERLSPGDFSRLCQEKRYAHAQNDQGPDDRSAP